MQWVQVLILASSVSFQWGWIEGWSGSRPKCFVFYGKWRPLHTAKPWSSACVVFVRLFSKILLCWGLWDRYFLSPYVLAAFYKRYVYVSSFIRLPTFLPVSTLSNRTNLSVSKLFTTLKFSKRSSNTLM